MPHRKFEHPEHGYLGSLQRKRSNRHREKAVHAFPKDDPSKLCRLTSFLGYKAGIKRVVGKDDIHGSQLRMGEKSERVTVIETPPMVVVAVVGYVKTPRCLRTLKIVWAEHLSEEVRTRFYKNWCKWKKKDFTKYSLKHETEECKNDVQSQLEMMKKYCNVIRVLAHSQIEGKKQKKAHLIEIQVNGGYIVEKVDYAYGLFKKEVHVDAVFYKDLMIDIISNVAKEKGYEGVVTRWGMTCFPRKTNCGLRKVACIGVWHPARAEQNEYHRCTKMNKKVYQLGKAGQETHSAMTEFDRTEKEITPKEDYLMIKGCGAITKKQVVTLRKSLVRQRLGLEEIKLKFIDTSSKYNYCRLRSTQGKAKFYDRCKT